MRIPRFYCPIAFNLEQQLSLPEPTFRHAIQVLRMNVGEPLILFNGLGGEYLARLINIDRRQAQVIIEAYSTPDRESPLEIHLALAIIKTDKMDFALQKAIELGVSAIHPLTTQRSVIRIGKEKADNKLQHWQGIITSATEQSGRTRLADIDNPMSLTDYLAQTKTGTRIIFSPGQHPNLKQCAPKLIAPLHIIIGPEGGFTDQEIEECQQAGALLVNLGERILRAETACLATLAIIQSLCGDI